jgi:hypothetical protein
MVRLHGAADQLAGERLTRAVEQSPLGVDLPRTEAQHASVASVTRMRSQARRLG